MLSMTKIVGKNFFVVFPAIHVGNRLFKGYKRVPHSRSRRIYIVFRIVCPEREAGKAWSSCTRSTQSGRRCRRERFADGFGYLLPSKGTNQNGSSGRKSRGEHPRNFAISLMWCGLYLILYLGLSTCPMKLLDTPIPYASMDCEIFWRFLSLRIASIIYWSIGYITSCTVLICKAMQLLKSYACAYTSDAQ